MQEITKRYGRARLGDTREIVHSLHLSIVTLPSSLSGWQKLRAAKKFGLRHDMFVAKIANTRLTKILWPFLHSLKGCQHLPPCSL